MMGRMFWELLGAGWAFVSRMLGRSLREWGRHARDEPLAAARELELVAGVLEARANAFRRQHGWRARRNREWAANLRAQARALRDNKLRDRACQVKPTEWSAKT